MFEYLRKIFADNQTSINQSPVNSSSESKNQKIEIAACALFIEIAKADGEFTDEERKFIISEMKSTFNLDDDYVNDLILLAEQRVKESVSLYEFTGVINTTFTFEEKIELIESLWKLIYKDEKLNQYEDHLIKRIAATINIEHKQIINAKLWVKEQMGLK
ncbi:MAG: TerB family tellurite resistance protein [Ignavibacteriales bacterium]|nr:MAG: TerB family tellurite resistance protein [Ignavibacteriales bacterium]